MPLIRVLAREILTTSGSGCRLAGSLGSELLSGSLSTGGLAGGLLCACHSAVLIMVSVDRRRGSEWRFERCVGGRVDAFAGGGGCVRARGAEAGAGSNTAKEGRYRCKRQPGGEARQEMTRA